MMYTSKKIQEILTSPSALEGLTYIQPIYYDAVTALWMMEANGMVMDTMRCLVNEISLQAMPQTATWGLRYYEEMCGLPVNESVPDEQRRAAVITTKKTRAPMNPDKVCQLIYTATGIPVWLYENTAKNTFTLFFRQVPSLAKMKTIYEILNKVKPAHIIYILVGKTEVCFENNNYFRHHKLAFWLNIKNIDITHFFLNGEHRLDGSRPLIWERFTLDGLKLPKFETGLFFKNRSEYSLNSLQMKQYYVNKINDNGLLTLFINFGVQNQSAANEKTFDLEEVFFGIRVVNIGLEYWWFNGQYQFNGVNHLDGVITIVSGLALQTFQAALFIQNKYPKGQSGDEIWNIDGLRFMNQNYMNQRSPWTFNMGAAVQNVGCLAAGLTIDSVWILNESYQLDGHMDLNADINEYIL